MVRDSREKESEITANGASAAGDALLSFDAAEMEVILSALPLTVVAVDRQVNIRYINHFLTEYISLPQRKLFPLLEEALRNPDEGPGIEKLFAVPAGETVAPFRSRVRMKSGFSLSIRWHVILKKQDLLWLAGNVVTREKTDFSIVEEKDFFRKAFEASLSGVAILDVDGNIIMANRTALDIFRITEINEEMQLNLFDLVTPETRENIDFKGRFKENGEVVNKVYEMVRADGQIVSLEASTAAVSFEEGHPRYVVSTFRDITEELRRKKKLEEALKRAEESDRLKTAFLTNMSHEIRTPMNAIVGFSGILADPATPEKDKKEYIRYIEQSSDTLLQLINDILDISKIESGQITINREKFPVEDLLKEIEAVAGELQTKYGKDHLTLHFHKMRLEECPVMISDPHRIKQVLNNLVGNAIKFTEKGFVEVTCSVKERKVIFLVKDTGPGIPEDEQATIFERFRQLDNSFTRKYGGVGLGLAITKNLVDRLGGTLSLTSSPGKGTLFKVTFPGVVFSGNGDSLYPEEEGAGSAPDFPDWSARTVLIAEDEKSNFDFLEAVLSKTRIRIRHAWTGREAVRMFREGEEPDLLLLDLRMPVLDGISALKEIRRRAPAVPAIAQTAFAMSDERRRCLGSGFDDYLAKPIRAAVLLEKMGALLDRKKKKGADL